ncbi:MAG: hypothetical protein KAX39_06345 [candidate division Zixibacteria bacterium]|nr:hypothetical protein [candidate division Zixibacteria bacterium]
MYECLFYNGWVEPPGYELLEIDTRKFGESPQEVLANPGFRKAVERCMKRYCESEEIDWDCIYLLNPKNLIRCSKLE